MYDDILIPTDGNAGVKRAIEHGLYLAEKHDATVHVLYVVDTSYSFTGAWDSVGEALERRGREAISEITEKAEEKGLEVVQEASIGVPHKIILEYAEEDDIDVIVMGTHGRGRIGEVLIGSVTQRVVRKSEKPVLTVRMLEEDIEDEELEEQERKTLRDRLNILGVGEGENGDEQEAGENEVDEGMRDESSGQRKTGDFESTKRDEAEDTKRGDT